MKTKGYMREKVAKLIFAVAAITSIIAVLLICIFLLINSVPAIKEVGLTKFLFGTEWSPDDVPASYGVFPMIVGSIYVTAGSIIIGVPIGILTAVFMAKYCPKKIYGFLKSGVNLMSGIPSVVYGFFGMVIIVPLVSDMFGGDGNSILTASILLGIMILPTIIGISESSISAVSPTYYEGALALGASKERSIFGVVLPAAKSGIFAAVILGVGRAIGETMAVIMVAGNQARMPEGILKGIRTLTTNVVMEMGYAADLHREVLIATGLVLFVFILIINLAFSMLRRKNQS